MAGHEKEITICSGCTTRSSLSRDELNKIIANLQGELSRQRPEINWRISTQSCFRFCPPDRTVLSVGRNLTMCRSTEIEELVKQILSFPDSVQE